MKKYLQYLLFALAVVVWMFSYCRNTGSDKKPVEASAYLNLNDTVEYVGSETCRGCHSNIYESFMRTGMGESFYHATPQKSAATFGQHVAVYDSINNFYYHPFWKDDSLFIREFRLSGKDTVFQRAQYIKYIIGSGQHTNSHIYDDNGYLFQAPVTFYTQKGIWDLAPGFEGGFSSRFNRIIGLECMTCHNSLPEFVNQSENKFNQVPLGIGCERCHGPGEVHVKQKMAGILVDTSLHTDFSIVNPRNLPTRELQMNVCQRCHLQGVSVLKAGKTFEDFKPGMPLTDVMDIFLPEYDGAQTKFIMASQAHRLTKSECYQKSEMTCLSCHNPHVSVKETPRSAFNNACINCHQEQQHQTVCTLPEQQRVVANQNDCSGCHLRVSGSIDIPHVTIHDHFIRKPLDPESINQIENFIGLVAATGGNPDALTRAKGYLHYFESYTQTPALLDSAIFYLQSSDAKQAKKLEVQIHALYLKSRFDEIIQLVKLTKPQELTDAWTAYRVGEAYLQLEQTEQALSFFEKAVILLPLQPDFNVKLGVSLLKLNRFDEAKIVFLKLLKEDGQHISALTNMGFIEVNYGNLLQAENYYLKALSLNPDYEQALLNLAGLKILQRKLPEAKQLIAQVLAKNPNNEQAKAIWQQLIR